MQRMTNERLFEFFTRGARNVSLAVLLVMLLGSSAVFSNHANGTMWWHMKAAEVAQPGDDNLVFETSVAVATTPDTQFTRILDGDPVNDGSSAYGVVWFDYDNDDYLDLFVSTSAMWDIYPRSNFLYHNNGDGTFSKVTSGDIVTDLGLNWSATCGDYDNDGNLDLYVVNYLLMNNFLYSNNGDGTFTKITSGPIVNDESSPNSASWVDYDNDGFLDLFTANDGAGGSYLDRRNCLFHNDGGTFTTITGVPPVNDYRKSHATAFGDYDNDGDRDLFLGNFGGNSNQLFVNNGDGTFTSVDGGHMTSDDQTTFGASCADYDNDGDLDVLACNGGTQSYNFLYENLGGTFVRVTSGPIATDFVATLGSCFGDYDNDGDLDLFIANGEFFTPFETTNCLYENNGDGTFAKVTGGEIATDMGISCGAAWGDYDRDGDLDLFVARFSEDNQNNLLYRNNGTAGNHWINIRCVGTISNRAAIGAKVRTLANINGSQVWQMREISGETGYGGQNLNAHFGFGNATTIDSIKFEWPSGLINILTDVPVDQFLVFTEFACGDADGSGTLDIDDVVYLINYIFPGGPPPDPLESGDVDCSGAVDIDDAIYLVNYIFAGGPSPSDPDGNGVPDC